MSGKRTQYHNLKVLRAAGLSDADLAAGNLVPIRWPLIECRQVDSWEELRALCAAIPTRRGAAVVGPHAFER